MNRRNLCIQIPRKNQPLSALGVILLISLVCGFLTDVLSLPSAVKYINDVMNVLLLILAVMNLSFKKVRLPRDCGVLLAWVALFFAFAAVVYVVNYQSVLYFLWGTRNNFRFYVFFLACVLFLSRRDVEAYLNFFDILLYVNAAVCLIQFFVFGLRQDNLGGIFGTEKGCNSYLNNFLMIVTVKTVLFYMYKRESLKQAIWKIVIALVVAALAELKFFYIEVVAIIAGSVLIARTSGRKLLLLIGGAAAVWLGMTIFSRLFPSFRGFFSLNAIVKMASESGYSSTSAVNRLTTIPILSKVVLHDPAERWFGLGLGNCDTSSFAFLNTPFFRRYEYLRYHWFSTAFLFLETGYVGLAFFFGFFVLVAWKGYKLSKQNADYEVYGQMAAIAAAMCILIGIYNSSLRTEAAYPIYFILAIPFVLQREKGRGRR